MVKPDILITGGGAMPLITPITKAGRDWCEENLGVLLIEGSISVSQSDMTQVVSDMKEPASSSRSSWTPRSRKQNAAT